MKIYISSDIEGTNGICVWNETDRTNSEFPQFAAKMTEEISAVCKGVNDFDQNSDILVKDAHAGGRNINHALLPENVRLNRAFSGHPFSMMNLIDDTFDASFMTGYHSPGYANGNPLAHTMSSSTYSKVLINKTVASEFLINYYTSLYYGVPVVMVSGDERLMSIVNETDADIVTVATVSGFGASVTSEHPARSLEKLRAAAKEAAGNAERLKATAKSKLPKHFSVELQYKRHTDAFRASFFPGVFTIDDHTIGFECDDYYEFLRMFRFC